MGSKALGRIAQRYDLALYTAAFRYREDDRLPLDASAVPPLPLLFDTTLYLDRGAGKLPRPIVDLIAARRHSVYTCGVVCAELAISIGLMDPNDPRTLGSVAAIQAELEQMEIAKTVNPSAAAWTEAAVLAGILARIQGLAVPKKNLTADQECCQKGRRRELLLDALLYLTAVENNMLLLSGNIRHMDLLLQIRPSRNVLLYRATE